VNEFAFTQIDTDVAERAFHSVEKHQITRFQLTSVDLLGRIGLLGQR
jgi:hypothetical protein